MDSPVRKGKWAAAKVFLAAGLVAILCSTLLLSCARLEGWGVVIWSVKGTTAKAGTVVPVYLKSNISKSYVIGLPEDKTKIEIPLPSLEFFSSKGAAEKRAQQFAPYAALYLSAGRDGLPVRDKASVSARRVYRLRLGESVKVLNAAEGEAVASKTSRALSPTGAAPILFFPMRAGHRVDRRRGLCSSTPRSLSCSPARTRGAIRS